MKFIISESQYRRLLSEQDLEDIVITGEKQEFLDKEEYDKAMKIYEIRMKYYNSYVDFLNALEKWKNFHIAPEKMTYEQVRERECELAYLQAVNLGYAEDADAFRYEDMEWKNGKWHHTFTSRVEWCKRALHKGMTKEEKEVKDAGLLKYDENGTTVVYVPETYGVGGEKYMQPYAIDPYTKPTKPRLITTNFSATFGQDGKQITKYFKTFDEWYKFYESTKGKFGFLHGTYNQSKTEGSMALHGVPSDWGL